MASFLGTNVNFLHPLHALGRVQISIDIFSFSAAYTDLASLAALSRYTCGQLYYIPGFNIARDGVRLLAEIEHNLTRTTGAAEADKVTDGRIDR
jgi:protein transport protein SEC24